MYQALLAGWYQGVLKRREVQGKVGQSRKVRGLNSDRTFLTSAKVGLDGFARACDVINRVSNRLVLS